MIALTFVTGILDVVGYLDLGKVFTGNMTGNIVVLGMAIAGAPGLHVAGPLFAFIGFALGALVAGVALRRSVDGWSRTHALLLTAGAGIALAVGITLLVGGRPTLALSTILAPLIAVQMGSQAMVARHLAVKDMTTVVVTSTLVSLAGESLTQGWRGAVLNRRLGAIVAILAGAAVGAFGVWLDPGIPVILTVIVTLGVVLVGNRFWRIVGP
jgi:uncharacterized membrane protein YoaK (UPF0700 family)